MEGSLRVKLQRFGAWCGIWYVVAIALGWIVIAGFVPPHRPADSPRRIAEIFHADALGIRIGMVFVMFAALVMVGFGAAVSKALARVERGFNLWVVLLIIPDQLLFFFQAGPFAWNGLFGLYVPLAVFFGWFAVTIYCLFKSADRVAAEHLPPDLTPSAAVPSAEVA